VKTGGRINALRFDDLKPSWRSGNPTLNSRRRPETREFALNGPGRTTLSNMRGSRLMCSIRIR
jgi:hypothetical protein